ncbi:MAG: hypothetical protein KDC53_21055 [Saprospiraceae bacterium]|nr:hypothetical protein [Saprospiraceae bacterium]
MIGHGIMLFDDDTFKPFIAQSEVQNLKVTGLVKSRQGEIIIATENNGLFKFKENKLIKWKTEVDDIITAHQINKLTYLSSGAWSIGTISDGLLIIDDAGHLNYHLNKNSGLQNNTVLSLFEDSMSNLWIGLDDGIDLLDLQSPITFYRDNSGQLGTVFDAVEFDNKLFLGTNQGLFYREISPSVSESPFTLVSGSQGQVLQLKIIDNQLFFGHNNGTFLLQNAELQHISKVSGGWNLQVVPDHPNILIEGTYTGLVIFKKTSNQWAFDKILNGFKGGGKQLAFNSRGNLWVVNPYRGLHLLKIDFEQDTILAIRSFTENDGIPSDYNITMVRYLDHIIFRCGTQYFTFNHTSEHFEEFTFNIPMPEAYDRILPFSDSLCFVVRENQLEIFKGISPLNHFSLDLVNNSERIVQLNEQRFLVCLENGYAILNPWQQQKTGPIAARAQIATFKAWDNLGNLEYDLTRSIGDWQSSITLPSRINRIEFGFASYDYSHQRPFRYQLEGFDLTWSPWSSQVRKEYTNLAPGSYQFNLQYEGVDKSDQLKIEQLPSWHQTTLARILFAAVVAAFVWVLVLYYDKQSKVNIRRLLIAKEREINRQRLELQNELLEREVKHKSQELANSTMNIIQKNKVLSTIKDQISEIRRQLGHQFPDKQYHQLIRMVQQHLSNQDDWKVFEMNFNDVHDNFFKMLKQDYPDLTAGDLKLAAYLKMNLSTKEIAPLLNISIRGVENKRYRLRQKMGLQTDENILDILLQY